MMLAAQASYLLIDYAHAVLINGGGGGCILIGCIAAAWFPTIPMQQRPVPSHAQSPINIAPAYLA